MPCWLLEGLFATLRIAFDPPTQNILCYDDAVTTTGVHSRTQIFAFSANHDNGSPRHEHVRRTLYL